MHLRRSSRLSKAFEAANLSNAKGPATNACDQHGAHEDSLSDPVSMWVLFASWIRRWEGAYVFWTMLCIFRKREKERERARETEREEKQKQEIWHISAPQFSCPWSVMQKQANLLLLQDPVETQTHDARIVSSRLKKQFPVDATQHRLRPSCPPLQEKGRKNALIPRTLWFSGHINFPSSPRLDCQRSQQCGSQPNESEHGGTRMLTVDFLYIIIVIYMLYIYSVCIQTHTMCFINILGVNQFCVQHTGTPQSC